MAYNLPPPWDPGYALPDNVRDEGLERRGFVTKQMPRGTYDMPKVNSGGYVLPQNVKDENYGQGTLTTKWLPRGYVDDPVRHRLNLRPKLMSDTRVRGRTRRAVMEAPIIVQPTNQGSAVAMSGDDMPSMFVQYGHNSAAIMLRAIQGLPQAKAKAKLKKIMDTIDPALWPRCAEFTRQFMAQGVSGPEALRAGLAKALSTGIVADIIATGRRGGAPQPRSLLGLGCYGPRGALGIDTANLLQHAIKVVNSGAQLQTVPVLQAGPWSLPEAPNVLSGPDGNTANLYDISKLTTEQKQTIASGLQKIIAKATLFGSGTTKINLQKTLGWPGSDANVPITALTGKLPFFSFTHPTTGKKCGVFMNVGTDPLHPGAEYKAHPYFRLKWAEVPESMGLWEFILWLPSKLTQVAIDLGQAGIDSIETAVKGISDQGCQVVNLPGAQTAGAAAGAYYGGAAGAQAGAQGVGAAQNACASPPPVVDLPPPSSSSGSSLMLPLAIGAVGVVAFLATRKKKTP